MKSSNNFLLSPWTYGTHVHEHTMGISVNFCWFVTGIVVRNTLVTYDRENDKIGFWKTNCSELWKSLHYIDPSTPYPLPPKSQSTNVSIPPTVASGGLPHAPAPAPDGLLHAVFPGRASFKHVHTFCAVFFPQIETCSLNNFLGSFLTYNYLLWVSICWVSISCNIELDWHVCN